jgi:hypothetical protein
MKYPRLTALRAKWMTGWSLGKTTPLRKAEPTPEQAKTEAVQEWEDEGGAIRSAKTPGTEPKIPL